MDLVLAEDHDVASCFEWLVNRLFSGVCVHPCIQSDDSALLYENPACSDVSPGMHTPLLVVSYVIDYVLSCVTFYLTDSLQDIVVAVQIILEGVEDRRVLIESSTFTECSNLIQIEASPA